MTESIGRTFMRETSLPSTTRSLQELGAPQPPLELPYPLDAKLIDLPAPAELEMPAINLREAAEQRRSVRHYAETSLSLEELSFLLWLTQGVKSVTDRPATLRTVPSAGARHAFETFLLVNRVNGLEPGLYRFIAIEHALLPFRVENGITEQVMEGCLNQESVRRCAAAFIWVAVVDRMYWRYGERGYRYLHLDAGHVCQNLALAAEAIDSTICEIGAFDDARLNTVLGLDGETLFVIYAGTVGKKRQ